MVAFRSAKAALSSEAATFAERKATIVSLPCLSGRLHDRLKTKTFRMIGRPSFTTRCRSGFTLIELLITIALIGILAAVVMPSSNPSVRDQLLGAAEVMASDLAYAQSLAVANGSKYKFTFDAAGYSMTHSGTNAALNNLPNLPFDTDNEPTKYIVKFADLPYVGPGVTLVGAYALRNNGTLRSPITQLEFGELGATTGDPESTELWLAAGSGTARRFISLRVDAITGLIRVGDYQAAMAVVSPVK